VRGVTDRCAACAADVWLFSRLSVRFGCRLRGGIKELAVAA